MLKKEAMRKGIRRMLPPEGGYLHGKSITIESKKTTCRKDKRFSREEKGKRKRVVVPY